MASSDNLAAIEPWMFRSPIGNIDSWYADSLYTRETESGLITKALQQSLFNQHQQQQQQSDFVSGVTLPVSTSFMVKQNDYCSTATASASTVTASGSGSEPETPGSRRRGPGPNLGVKTANKRKSRASKRSMTTFIQADPSNFRQMVQQVTGVKVDGNRQFPVSPVVKPEAVRQPFINKLQGLLPTLDTSRYLLDHHNNNNNTPRISVSGVGFSRNPTTAAAADSTVGGGIDFDSFCSFPTLESWN